MHFDYSVNKDRKFYKAAVPAIKLISFAKFKVTCKGKENIPKDRGFILAANHISFFDPAVIISNIDHTVHFMAKSELFENPALAFIVRNLNAFPVKRGYSDRKALMYAINVVENGGVLGIFPEGRRVRSAIPDSAKTGIAFIAKRTGADVLPVCLYINPMEDVVRPKLTLIFGEVIKNSELDFDSEKSSSQKVRYAAEYIMNKITELWETENENTGG